MSLPFPLSKSTWIFNDYVGKHLFDTHQVSLTFRAANTSKWNPFGFDYINPPLEALKQFVYDGQTGPLAISNPVFIAYETLVDPTTNRSHNFQITVFPHAIPHANVTESPRDITICFNHNNPASRDAMGFRNATNYGALHNTLYWDNQDDLEMMFRFINLTINRMVAVGTTPIFPPPAVCSFTNAVIV